MANQQFSSSSPSPLFPTSMRLHVLVLSLLAVFVGIAQSWPIDSANGEGVFLLKKSDAPQWEDLGWAWGKRAAPGPAAAPQWDDLGWSWGKRSGLNGAGRAGADAAEELIERAQEQLKMKRMGGGRSSGQQALISSNRVMRSAAVAAAAKNPDWHDLGWAWGRRK